MSSSLGRSDSKNLKSKLPCEQDFGKGRKSALSLFQHATLPKAVQQVVPKRQQFTWFAPKASGGETRILPNQRRDSLDSQPAVLQQFANSAGALHGQACHHIA